MALDAVILSSIVGAALPAVTDAFSAIIARLTGGAGALPKNVDDVIKLKQAEIDQIKALSELDKPSDNISPWVANLRASFRPIIAISAFIMGIACLFVPGVPENTADNIFGLATMVTSYLFGERFMFGMKGFGKNK